MNLEAPLEVIQIHFRVTVDVKKNSVQFVTVIPAHLDTIVVYLQSTLITIIHFRWDFTVHYFVNCVHGIHTFLENFFYYERSSWVIPYCFQYLCPKYTAIPTAAKMAPAVSMQGETFFSSCV